MQSKSIRFDVHIGRAIIGIPRVVECAQLGLVRGRRCEQVRLERLLGQPPDAVQAPHIVVLVIQIAIPALARQRTVAQVAQLQIREDHLEHVVRQVADDAGRRLAAHGPRVASHLPNAARARLLAD